MEISISEIGQRASSIVEAGVNAVEHAVGIDIDGDGDIGVAGVDLLRSEIANLRSEIANLERERSDLRGELAREIERADRAERRCAVCRVRLCEIGIATTAPQRSMLHA